MAIRKCLKCFKRIPEADGACPHCGHLNASIGNHLTGFVAIAIALAIVGTVLGGFLFLTWKGAGSIVDAAEGAFDYEADLLLEVTGTGTAEIYYTDGEFNGHTLEHALLPWSMTVRDVGEMVLITLRADPDETDGRMRARIIDAKRRTVLAEGETGPGLHPVATAEVYVREPKD